MKRMIYIILAAFTVTNSNAQTKTVSRIEWREAATLPPAAGKTVQPGVAGPVAGISNNVLIVAGGANFPGGMPWEGAPKKYHDDIYIFRKAGNSIAPGEVSRQRLPQPVAYCASVTTPAGIVYIGGQDEKHISAKVISVVYDSASGEITFTTLPPLPVPLTNAAAAYHNHVIYVAGGESVNGPSRTFFSLDITSPGAAWQTLPGIPEAVAYTVMAVQRNAVYLLGGRRKNAGGISDIFNTVFRFNLETQQWSAQKPLPYPVSAGTGLAVGARDILLFSGDKGATFHRSEELEVAIAKEKDTQKKQALLREKAALMTAHPGFTKDVLLYNTATERCTKINPLSYEGQATTSAFIWNGNIMIPSGEIKAGVRTPVVMSGKIYFN